jgi:hypothetical protein
MRRVNILIASPGDVQEERDAVLKVFNRWNNANPDTFLNAVMWESASVPTLGDHPQHILNDQMIEKSDLLVAILWSKLGTPTPTAKSGTLDEIGEFIEKKGPQRVMLYFCTRDIPYDINPTEFAKLRIFKEQMASQGLFHEYRTVDEFEGHLYRHLDTKVQQFVTGQLRVPAPRDEAPQKRDVSKDLPADPRLHHLIDFGTSLADISRGFAARMDKFDAIDGFSNDKFYALGAHVYSSVANCLDRFLGFSASGMSEQNRTVIERISVRLKRLAANLPDPNEPFPQYWTHGREISDDLSAQVAFVEKWKT